MGIRIRVHQMLIIEGYNPVTKEPFFDVVWDWGDVKKASRAAQNRGIVLTGTWDIEETKTSDGRYVIDVPKSYFKRT